MNNKINILINAVTFIGVFIILFLLVSNFLDIFFVNRSLTLFLSIISFLVILVASFFISRKLSEWIEHYILKSYNLTYWK